MPKNVTSIEQYVINFVRKKRTKLGLSQSDIAEILNISPGFIGKVESLKYPSKYNLNHIYKLSIYFHCSPQLFLPKSAKKNNE